MTPKQRRFAEEYIVDLNATQAAIRAGISLGHVAPATGYYTYLVICPETGRILYVGKGKKRRMFAHVRDARRGTITSVKKHRLLMKYLNRGVVPVPVTVETGLTEGAALALERELISAIGLENLGNADPGGATKSERDLAGGKEMENRIVPFRDWLAAGKRSEDDIKIYKRFVQGVWDLVRHLEKCVEYGVAEPYEITITRRGDEVTIEPAFLDPRRQLMAA